MSTVISYLAAVGPFAIWVFCSAYVARERKFHFSFWHWMSITLEKTATQQKAIPKLFRNWKCIKEFACITDILEFSIINCISKVQDCRCLKQKKISMYTVAGEKKKS